MEQRVTQTPDTAAKRADNPWLTALKTPWAGALAALLGVQLVLAIALSLGGRGGLDPTALDKPLLDFDPGQVTALAIEGGGADPDAAAGVTLSRVDDGWVIAGLGAFPAEGARVDDLLNTLKDLKRPLPVATSPEALARHKVADDAFERRVTLKAGDAPIATLILGDSPGFRRTFARPAGDPAVYDLALPLFEIPAEAGDWISRDQLRVGRETIERIQTPDWTLVKGEDGWQLAGSDTPPDGAVVETLLSRLAGLSYQGVLGVEEQPEYGQDQPSLTLTLGLADGTSRTYRVSAPGEGEELVLKSDAGPWYYALTEYHLEGVLGTDRARLLGETPAADTGTSGEAVGASGAAAIEPSPADPAPEAPSAQPVPAPAGESSAAQTQPGPAADSAPATPAD